MIALLIDVGNSRVKWRAARVEAGDRETFPEWVSAEGATWLHDVDRIEAAFRTLSIDRIHLVFIANVASEAAGSAVQTAVTRAWPSAQVQLVRSAAASTGLVNAYRDPRQLGVDRWLAALAAHALFPDRAVLICTFGTATTIDLVERHRFVGGLIIPGIDAMRHALTTSTARLPASVGRVVDFGDSTEDAITSGVMAAQMGAVERALRKARDRASPADPLCVVAGGAAGTMTTLFEEVDAPHCLIHDLVLRGLAHTAREALVSSNDAATSTEH